MIDARVMLDELASYARSPDQPVRLGVVDPAYAAGAPKVTLEGTSTLSPEGFATLYGYVPLAGDRVALLPVGNTYLILGRVATSIAPVYSLLPAHHERTTTPTSTTNTVATTAQKIFEAPAVAVKAGRRYLVRSAELGVWSPAAGRVALQLNYTTDGSLPGPASTRLRFNQRPTSAGGNVDGMTVEEYYTPATDHTFRVVLSYYGLVAGTYNVYVASDWKAPIAVHDLGVYTGGAGTNF